MKYLLWIICIFLFFNCATLTRGTGEALEIYSNPAGASVVIKEGENIIFTGMTPTAVKLERKGNYSAIIEKEEYEPIIVNITNQVSSEGGAGMAGNCLVGGCCGAGVDAASGAMLELMPNPINVDLVPLKTLEQE